MSDDATILTRTEFGVVECKVLFDFRTSTRTTPNAPVRVGLTKVVDLQALMLVDFKAVRVARFEHQLLIPKRLGVQHSLWQQVSDQTIVASLRVQEWYRKVHGV